MNKEFHYYITYLIAARAGLSPGEAFKVAYSSQYVDDNDIVFKIRNPQGEAYTNYISQTLNILKPKMELFRIYPIFHFIPGEPNAVAGRRRDGKLHYLNTTPDSHNARAILTQALDSGNLYQIGIAIHGFADTWAHQNFTGYYDAFNAMKGPRNRAAPRIGHAGAGHRPDRVDHFWRDHRLLDGQVSIDNTIRFMKAAERIFEELWKRWQPLQRQERFEIEKERLIDDLLHTIAAGGSKVKRIQLYQVMAQKEAYGKTPLPKYDADYWMDEAVREDVRGFRVRSQVAAFRMIKSKVTSIMTPLQDLYTWKDEHHYQLTDWYRFQEAVKEHQKMAGEILYASTFNKMELKNW